MATVTGLTATRMQEIEDSSVVDGDVVSGNLILTKHDGSQINAGSVIGPVGPQGPPGIAIVAIPGEVRLWPGASLPPEVEYGKWVWANGDPFIIVDYPLAAAHIDPAWNTAMGWSAPPAGQFRVPDLRGVIPAGLDAMPIGSARANRMTRADAIILAKKTGEELHRLTIPEAPIHTHVQNPHNHPPAAGNRLLSRNSGPAKADIGSSWAEASAEATTTGNATATNQSTGGDVPHENVQPTVFVPYIVKLDD